MEEKMRGPENAQTKHTYVNDMDIDGGGLNGFGMALDLGAEYKLDKDWTFSAALLDFGFISWNNNIVASTNGERTFTTDKYIFHIAENADNKFGFCSEHCCDSLEDTANRGRVHCNICFLADGFAEPIAHYTAIGGPDILDANLQCA